MPAFAIAANFSRKFPEIETVAIDVFMRLLFPDVNPYEAAFHLTLVR